MFPSIQCNFHIRGLLNFKKKSVIEKVRYTENRYQSNLRKFPNGDKEKVGNTKRSVIQSVRYKEVRLYSEFALSEFYE